MRNFKHETYKNSSEYIAKHLGKLRMQLTQDINEFYQYSLIPIKEKNKNGYTNIAAKDRCEAGFLLDCYIKIRGYEPDIYFPYLFQS